MADARQLPAEREGQAGVHAPPAAGSLQARLLRASGIQAALEADICEIFEQPLLPENPFAALVAKARHRSVRYSLWGGGGVPARALPLLGPRAEICNQVEGELASRALLPLPPLPEQMLGMLTGPLPCARGAASRCGTQAGQEPGGDPARGGLLRVVGFVGAGPARGECPPAGGRCRYLHPPTTR
jgi:hypothetical protein